MVMKILWFECSSSPMWSLPDKSYTVSGKLYSEPVARKTFAESASSMHVSRLNARRDVEIRQRTRNTKSTIRKHSMLCEVQKIICHFDKQYQSMVATLSMCTAALTVCCHVLSWKCAETNAVACTSPNINRCKPENQKSTTFLVFTDKCFFNFCFSKTKIEETFVRYLDVELRWRKNVGALAVHQSQSWQRLCT